MPEHVRDDSPNVEALGSLPEPEAVPQGQNQEVVVALWEGLTQGILDERSIQILRLRAGADGQPLTLGEIGALSEVGLTRQRIQVILKRALRVCPVELIQAYPTLDLGKIPRSSPSPTQIRNERLRIRRYCLDAGAKKSLQYVTVHRAASAPVPAHRAQTAALLTTEESCSALNADYRITIFGTRFRVCPGCDSLKRWPEFYLKANGRPYQYCRSCDEDRCRSYQDRRRGHLPTPSDRLP